MRSTYEDDLFAWSVDQGKLLRERRFDAIDRWNIANEIEQLGRDDEIILCERLRVLLTALLRWAYQGDLRSTALASTIISQRIAIEQILADSASLRPEVDLWVIEMYPEAKRLAVMESGLFEESFPEGLPFLPSEVLDMDCLPDPFNEDADDAWWRRNRKRRTKSG